MMPEENLTNDLHSLSQTWSERVKSIRQMAKNDGTVGHDEDFAEFLSSDSLDYAPTEEELFVNTSDMISKDSKVYDIFANHADINGPMPEIPPVADPVDVSQKEASTPSTFTQKMLIISLIVTILIVLSYGVFLNLSSIGLIDFSEKTNKQQTIDQKAEAVIQEQDQDEELELASEEPISLKIAQDYFQKAEYSRSHGIYKRLSEALSKLPSDQALRGYLQLNMGLCLQKAGDVEKSSDMLKKASMSRSPVVSAYANYYLCLFEMDKRQFLVARNHAFKAISILDAIVLDTDWMHTLRRDCYFLMAEAATRESLQLSDRDTNMPPKLWLLSDTWDAPLSIYDEQKLREILDTGCSVFDQALLSPKILSENIDGLSKWTAICNGASIEELLGRIASNIKYDIRWESGSDRESLRTRPVNLYLSAVNDQQLVMIAAGSAGLLAHIDEQNMITIYNPARYSHISEQISLLSQEAISCWQRYILAFNEDRYLPKVHFALGALLDLQGLTTESLAQYKIVSGRYFSSSLGANALVCTAKLKRQLHDYQGSYEDLKAAVEQYPDHKQIDQTYLALAKAAEKINMIEQAAKIYSKVYYLKKTPKSQLDAALSAGRLFYEKQDYQNAEKWLTEYVNLAKKQNDNNLSQACMLLGRTWLILGDNKSACKALRVALSGSLSQQDYVETVTGLAEVYMMQNCFVEALEVLNETSSRQFPPKESVQLLLLKSRAFRGAGLTEKSISLLTDREVYIIDEFLKAKISYELSECYIEQNQLDLAYRRLSQILEQLGYSALEYKIACRLTEVCLKLDMDSQALNVGSNLLEKDPPQEIKKKTLELLAAVYQKQENYDRAALALLGQW